MRKNILEDENGEKSPYTFDKRNISIMVASVVVVGVVVGASIGIGMQKSDTKVNGSDESIIGQNTKYLKSNLVKVPDGRLLIMRNTYNDFLNLCFAIINIFLSILKKVFSQTKSTQSWKRLKIG